MRHALLMLVLMSGLLALDAVAQPEPADDEPRAALLEERARIRAQLMVLWDWQARGYVPDAPERSHLAARVGPRVMRDWQLAPLRVETGELEAIIHDARVRQTEIYIQMNITVPALVRAERQLLADDRRLGQNHPDVLNLLGEVRAMRLEVDEASDTFDRLDDSIALAQRRLGGIAQQELNLDAGEDVVQPLIERIDQDSSHLDELIREAELRIVDIQQELDVIDGM